MKQRKITKLLLNKLKALQNQGNSIQEETTTKSILL